jgi:hypothetical protein
VSEPSDAHLVLPAHTYTIQLGKGKVKMNREQRTENRGGKDAKRRENEKKVLYLGLIST